MAIDIGAGATDRGSTFNAGWTIIDYNNAANASGWITSVSIWAATDLAGCVIGVFTANGSGNFTCRDRVLIGAVTAGSKQDFTSGVKLWCETGDYLGIYYTSGTLERDTSGAGGIYYQSGNCGAFESVAYILAADDAISIEGSGTEATIFTFGNSPIDRASTAAAGNTTVDTVNPAAQAGTLYKIQYCAGNALSDVQGGVFYVVAGSNLSTRGGGALNCLETHYCSGLIAAGVSVQVGDYVGMYWSANTLDSAASGGGSLARAGDNIPCTNAEFTAGEIIYSIRAVCEAAAGWTNIAKVGGIAAADIAKINGVAVADIAKINGVAV